VPQKSSEAGFVSVPKLEELAADPAKAGVLDGHTTELLETKAIIALNALRNRKLTLAAQARASQREQRPDQLLTVKEVAKRLGFGVDWVYKKHHRLPFRVRPGTVPRFSEKGLEKYIREHQGS
jgi:excisionase family DNA binding protein